MKRTRGKMKRTKFVIESSESNLRKINSLLIDMALAYYASDKQLFKKLDKKLFTVQQKQFKLKKHDKAY